MAFDYEKIKKDQEGGSHWATYSDLFMVLSLVFLLLYVVASLRNGTHSLHQQMEYQELAQQKQDLQEQIRVYNTLKDNYLQTGASQNEMALYQELMGKLDLLQEEARDEKQKLQQAAQDNAVKEVALNKYQQMIRNIVNANLVSQARIKKRDRVITKKDEVISEKKIEIKDLEKNVKKKEQVIAKGESEIGKLEKKVKRRVRQLKLAAKKQQISKKVMRKKIAKLKTKNNRRIKKLKKANMKAQQEMQKASQEIAEATQELELAQKTISAQGQTIAQLGQQKKQVQHKMRQIESDFSKKMMSERQAFLKKMKSQKMSARARELKQDQFRRRVAKRERELAKKLGSMKGKLEQTNSALASSQSEKESYKASLSGLKKEKQQLSSNLKKMKDLQAAKKNLINKIKNNLRKSGLKAEVDPKSGDVVINFGKEYFDAGSASLKPQMRKTLEKFMPLYAKSLFEDKDMAKKIESVEIIGFASPTYKGKYVDPVSLESKNKEAVNYNLDLSYYRARSIFDHIFDKQKMVYRHQKHLLPKVKVTGKSFFTDGPKRGVASGMSQKEYCAKYDCKKAQRVIIRFDLDNL